MKRNYYLVVIGLVLAFAGGRYFSPTKTETKTVEKIVYRETKDKDQTVTRRETRFPNGTVVTEETKKTETHTETKKDSQASNTTKVWSRPSYSLGVVYEPGIKGFQDESYRGIIQRRIFGEIYAGLSVSTKGTLGLVLTVGF